MKSVIWRIATEKIGTLEPFKSEYEMEAFLMNHPELIGCWELDSEAPPRLLRQQLATRKHTGDAGRIDLVGLVPENDTFHLKIFELKKGEIGTDHVQQLIEYLTGWEKEDSALDQTRRWVSELALPGLNSKQIGALLRKPRGVIVGTSFSPDAITLAKYREIDGIRLARFLSQENDYYVIIEDQVGGVVSRAERHLFAWHDLEKAGLITPKDRFWLRVKGRRLEAKPDQKTFDRPGKRFMLMSASRKFLLDHAREILRNAPRAYDRKLAERTLMELKAPNAINYTGATCLAFLLDGKLGNYWTPSRHWTLARTGETIQQLESQLRQG